MSLVKHEFHSEIFEEFCNIFNIYTWLFGDSLLDSRYPAKEIEGFKEIPLWNFHNEPYMFISFKFIIFLNIFCLQPQRYKPSSHTRTYNLVPLQKWNQGGRKCLFFSTTSSLTHNDDYSVIFFLFFQKLYS